MNKPKWSVVSAIPRDDYTLLLTFSDGKKGIYDFKKDLACPFMKDRGISPFSCKQKLCIHPWYGLMTVI